MAKSTGAPKVYYAGGLVTLPQPLVGGRSDKWPVERESHYVDIDGILRTNYRLLRYEGVYKFGTSMLISTYDWLVGLKNSGHAITWLPHNDFPQLSIPAVITEINLLENKVASTYIVTMKLRAVGLVSSQPTIGDAESGSLLYQSSA